MKNYLKKIIQYIKVFFIKTVDREDIDLEEKGRRKLYVVFLLIIFFPLALFGILHIKKNLPQYGIINISIAASILFGIYILRYLKKGEYLFRFTVFIKEIILVYWIFTGAFQGYSILYVLVFPPFAFFLMGKKEGFLWSLSIAFFCLLIFINPFHQLNSFHYSFPFFLRHITSLLIVILFTYFYEAEREKYKEGMDREQRNLLEERNFLAIAKDEADRANELIKMEIEEKRKYQMELQNNQNNLEEIVADRTNELRQRNSELQEALNELDISENHYRILADNITDMIWSMDMSLKFTYFSPSVKLMFGLTVEEAMLKPYDRWSTPVSHKLIMDTLKVQLGMESDTSADPDRSIILYLEQYKKDGSVLPVECRVSFLRDQNKKLSGIVGITRDISERIDAQKEKELIQAQLAQAQKMEAMGTLVGGLAHGFNNLLGGIIGSMDLIKINLDEENLKNPDDIYTYFNVAMDSATRSTNIIKQLMTISRKRKLELAPIDINRSIKHVLDICNTSFPKSINIDLNISGEELVVLAEEIQIEQVLLNLCINASHAMTMMRPDKSMSGGTLSITSSRIILDENLHKTIPDADEFSSWICIQITDTGVGIVENDINRIFEPFFTTKKHEEGTGLGLSISYSIVKQHNGFIRVSSTPGKTTTFSVYLPEFETAHGINKINKKDKIIIHGKGTILVIDDEKIIIDVVKGILSRSGYDVLSALSPEEGIAIYKEKSGGISAVILDLSMPQMSGIEMYKILRGINPGIKSILSSGMLDNETRHEAFKLGITEVLYKPFNAAELTAVMGKILN